MVGILWQTRDLCAPLENRFYTFYRGLCVRKGLIIMEGWYIYLYIFSVSCSNATIHRHAASSVSSPVSFYLFLLCAPTTAAVVELYRILRKPFGGEFALYTQIYSPTRYVLQGWYYTTRNYILNNLAMLQSHFPQVYLQPNLNIQPYRT